MDGLLLLSGNDIPFVEAQLNVRQPKIKELGLLGEENFFIALDLLNLSKEKLQEQDKKGLDALSDFDILMSMITQQNIPAIQLQKENIQKLLYLIFPNSSAINFLPRAIVVAEVAGQKEDGNPDIQMHMIDASNYDKFKEILNEVFCLKLLRGKDELDYNPKSEQAKRIAEKLKKGREKAAAEKGESGKKVEVLKRYVSIISIGKNMNINEVLDYTMYQLFEEFNRFEKKEIYDTHLKAQLAGATGLKEVEHWMQ